MDRQLIQLVWNRAGGACEYCCLPSALYDTPFHVDHVISQQHGGQTVAANLALACLHCNLHKGPNIAGIDADTRQMVALFHPRKDRWQDHFQWNGPMLDGRTPTGRATIATLLLNEPEFVLVRAALMEEGMFPFA